MLGTGEDQRVVDVAPLQKLQKQRCFPARGHGVRGVGHTRGRRGLLLKGDLRWCLEDLLGQLLDGGRHGGAEEEGLLRLWYVPEHAPDVGQETHVQHAVGLVQNQILEP